MVVGLLVGVGTVGSGVLITLVNSWMNTPNGFDVLTYVKTGQIIGVNPLETLWPSVAAGQVPITWFGAWFVGFGTLAGYFAFRKLFSKNLGVQEKEYYNRGLKLATYLAALDGIFLALAGHNAGQVLYSVQPLKLATLEGLMQGGYGAPITIGPISIPKALSFLSTWNPDAYVMGYSNFVSSVWNSVWWLANTAYLVHSILGIIGAIVFWLLGYSM